MTERKPMTVGPERILWARWADIMTALKVPYERIAERVTKPDFKPRMELATGRILRRWERRYDGGWPA